VCTLEDLGLHGHTDACLDESGEYCCGYSDFVVHEHDDSCYDADGNLWCPIPEVKAHTHGEGCYAQLEAEPVHTHTDECYTAERGELICAIPEGDGAHTHSGDAGCYDENGELVCQMEESAGHQHMDSCYAQNKVLACQLSTEPAEEPAEPQLICDKAEIILHRHDAGCLDGNGNLICGKTQVLEHVHDEACFQPEGEPVLSCDLEEHTHSAACSVIGLIAVLPEQKSVEERIAAFEADGDEAGGDAYLSALQAQVQEAYEAYAALPEEEQAKVTNAGKLAGLEWLLDAEPLADTVPGIIYELDSGGTAAGSAEAVALSTEIESKLAAWLKSKGYKSVDTEVYKIGFANDEEADAWSLIQVDYSSNDAAGAAGLQNLQGSELLVLDLGEGGTQEPEKFYYTPIMGISPGLYTAFAFGRHGITRDPTSHVYAFISAVPLSLTELEIYPGTPVEGSDNKVWVAMDGPDEDHASVKAIITLTDDSTALPNCFPFVSKVNPGDDYYPSSDAVFRAVGAVNDVQCYKIHWVERREDGTYDFNTGMEVGNGKNALIQLEYLKDDAQLKGEKGGRKLRIFSSKSADGENLLEISNSVQNVKLMENNYKGFTFRVTEPCPYVFVSEAVEKGYIKDVQIAGIVDGSEPFDKSDTPGNDSSDSNKIVRSYDTIQYKLAVTFDARQSTVTEPNTKMYFELILSKSATAARFAFDKMLWLGDHYGVEYLDADDNVVMVMDHKGGFYAPLTDESGAVCRDESGFALADTKEPVSFNSQITGSLAGENSYKVATGGVVKQRLTGWTIVKPQEGQDSALVGTQTFTMAVEVRNADNGEVFEPSFKLWLDGNEQNYGPESANPDGTLIPATPVGGNVVTAAGDNAVKVSAGTNFNLQLGRNTDMSYKNWFDFSTGNVVAEPTRSELVRLASLAENHGKSNPSEFTEDNKALPAQLQAQYANYRYGRITCYGITLQLYNDTDNKPEENRASKGLKGMSLPVGDITFDLNFWSEVTGNGQSLSADEYTAILWDYNENVPANTSYSYSYKDPAYTVGNTTYPARGWVTTPNDGLGNGGRNLYWDGESRSPYAKGGAPSAFPSYHGGCYYSGDWALVNQDGEKLNSLESMNQVAAPTRVTGSGRGTTYHFNVSDYDFDFDSQHFPVENAGNSGNVTGYDTYARCFSAGCVQVLSVFPMVQKESVANVYLHAEVSNLHLTTRAGQELTAQEGDDTKIGHEVNTADNKKKDQIVLYAPGNLTKGSAFNGKYKGNPPNTIAEGFLGTEYWTTSYDCSTFAGDDIWLMSYGMMASGSDYRTRSMNLLQLFDSRALSVRENEPPSLIQNWDPDYDKKGEAAFLYAADPDYPKGYDTNADSVLAYMNTVREEDLVYYTSLEDLENAGYTCVGVLMELRHCDLLGGKYQYMRIPIKVNGDDEKLVSQTVATVNTFRVWSYDLVDQAGKTITWADGRWDKSAGENTLAGYSKPTTGITGDQYAGELANSSAKSPPNYVKTEYEDGLQVHSTHAGGTLSGNSLLILGYKAHIDIKIDNKPPNSGAYIYHQGNGGDRVVDYRLTNIIAETAAPEAGAGKPQTTQLTIRAALDENNTTKVDRLLVSDGSYRIRGYKAGANGEPVGEETELSISTDSNHPTSLYYQGSDGKMHQIQVYAQMANGGRGVSFVIKNAPVGIQLPDITFQANFGPVNVLKNNDTFKTGVYISGQGDVRAYDQAKGNASNATVGVVVDDGTNLSKSVDVKYIELGDTIEYTVTYSNRGNTKYDAIYFYDLLPSNDDIRGSSFDGQVVLRAFDMETKGPKNIPLPSATVYYSTVPYKTLYDEVSTFGGEGAEPAVKVQNIEAMLSETGDDRLFYPLGTITGTTGLVNDPSLPTDKAELAELMDQITGLYVKVEDLQGQQSVDLKLWVKTQGNQAGNIYKNVGNSWIANSPTLPLMSNQVQTQVVSRSISGVVWHDKNLNGVRDDGEPLLDNVTATLFKKGADGTYKICTEDVTGAPISGTCVTGAKDSKGQYIMGPGEYSFGRLPAVEVITDGAGKETAVPLDYIVVFSGGSLGSYTGPTSYQVHGGNDSTTNDGMEIASLTADGIERGQYLYYIKYSAGSDAIRLHSLADIVKIQLDNGVEAVSHQDLGVVIAGPELPMTGGSGTAGHTLGGLSLMAGAALWMALRRKHKRV